MKTFRRVGLSVVALAALLACGGQPENFPEDDQGDAGEPTTGGTAGGTAGASSGARGSLPTTGGASTGGAGGAPGGTAGLAGAVQGGSGGDVASGGTAGVFGLGGSATGGVSSGGTQTGGSLTGGTATGGSVSTGGAASGGMAGGGAGGSSSGMGGVAGQPASCSTVPASCTGFQSCTNVGDCRVCDIDRYRCVDTSVYTLFRTTDGQEFRCSSDVNAPDCVTARNSAITHCCPM